MRERDELEVWNDGGGSWGRGFGGVFRVPQNRFQTHIPPPPEREKDRNLFRMCPGRRAALSAPWWAHDEGLIGGVIEWGQFNTFFPFI
jgi:hypothetical protein